MAPFATLHTFTQLRHAKETKIMATAHISGLEVAIAPNFELGTSNRTPEFLAKFPMGQVPSLETATGFCLSEGTAICHYLACSGPKRAQLLGSTPEEEAIIQMWISLGESEIFPNVYAALSPMLGREPYVDWVVKRKDAALMKAVARMELWLQGHEWFGGSQGANLADLSLGSACYWPFQFLWEQDMRDKYPRVVDWYKRIFELDDGIKKAFGEEPQFCEKRMPPFPEDGKSMSPSK